MKELIKDPLMMFRLILVILILLTLGFVLNRGTQALQEKIKACRELSKTVSEFEDCLD